MRIREGELWKRDTGCPGLEWAGDIVKDTAEVGEAGEEVDAGPDKDMIRGGREERGEVTNPKKEVIHYATR